VKHVTKQIARNAQSITMAIQIPKEPNPICIQNKYPAPNRQSSMEVIETKINKALF